MTLSALGIFSAAGAGGAVAAGAYELISTTILGTNTASVTFSSLGTYSSTYKHLQIRAVTRTTRTDASQVISYLRFNGDTASNYSGHQLFGNGSGVGSAGEANITYAYAGIDSTNQNTTGNFAAYVIDILDPYSTTKNKTTRSLSGLQQNAIRLMSGNWRNTASVTSIQLVADSYNYVAGSRFSLYGIKG
jgi:hypothetical protein